MYRQACLQLTSPAFQNVSCMNLSSQVTRSWYNPAIHCLHCCPVDCCSRSCRGLHTLMLQRFLLPASYFVRPVLFSCHLLGILPFSSLSATLASEILSFLSGSWQSFVPVQEEQRELAKTIRVSGSILLSTVSNFLDFFKMEAGKQLDVVRTEMTTKVLLSLN